MTLDSPKSPLTLRTAAHTVVRVVLIVAAICALWRWVDWARVWGALATMSPVALLIAVALASADRVLMGYKWRQLVRAAGGSLRLRDATNIYYQTCFTDLVFPNVVASEGLRVYLGRRLGDGAGAKARDARGGEGAGRGRGGGDVRAPRHRQGCGGGADIRPLCVVVAGVVAGGVSAVSERGEVSGFGGGDGRGSAG